MGSFIRLVPATLDHIGPIAENMRAWDVAEAAAFGHSPYAALRIGLIASVDCYTALLDDVPEAMLGLVPGNLIEGEGSPWLLGTEAVYRHPRAMLAFAPKILAMFSDSTPSLHNLVAAGNDRAIRYLRRIGFTVGKEPVVIGGTDFVTFTMERR